MRKMILTGALVLFGAGTTPQVVAALAVCIAWLMLIANLKPFGDDMDDRLAQMEALQVLTTLLMGLVLQLQATGAGGSQADDEALGILLVALNCTVIALALVQQPIVRKVANRVCVEPYRRCKNRVAAKDSAQPSDRGTNVVSLHESTTATVTGMEMISNPSHRVKAAPLPAGWEEREHEGTPYYKHTETGETSWVHPSDTLTLTLPTGWEKREHEGTPYYKHTETGEKSWVHPSVHPVSKGTEEQCPRGWSSHEHTGRVYYSNDHTHETTYDKPLLPAVPEGWSVHSAPPGSQKTHYFQHDAGGGGTQWHHPFDDSSNDASAVV